MLHHSNLRYAAFGYGVGAVVGTQLVSTYLRSSELNLKAHLWAFGICLNTAIAGALLGACVAKNDPDQVVVPLFGGVAFAAVCSAFVSTQSKM